MPIKSTSDYDGKLESGPKTLHENDKPQSVKPLGGCRKAFGDAKAHSGTQCIGANSLSLIQVYPGL